MNELRPVIIDDNVRGLFHKWVDVSDVVPPSLMAGGHPGGVVRDTFALVEKEDGTMATVRPLRVKFIDSIDVFLMNADYFDQSKKEDNTK